MNNDERELLAYVVREKVCSEPCACSINKNVGGPSVINKCERCKALERLFVLEQSLLIEMPK
jgi:hypothetical protein